MPADAVPFLPEPDPVPPPQHKPRARKTLVLWVLLVLMFLAIWQFLSPSGEAHPRPEAPACEPSFWSASLLTVVLPFGLFGLIFFWFFRTYRQSVDFNLSQERARIALAEGRAREAIDAFVRLAASHARRPAYETGALLSLAQAQLWAGAIDDAIATLVRVERARRVLGASHVRTLAAAHLAFAYALAGQLDAADRWVREARARVAKNRDDRLVVGAHLRLAEATIAIRQGDAARGATLLDERWSVLREALSARTMRVVEVVRALAEAGGGVREYHRVGERLVRIEPTTPGEMAFLGARWPEMHAFLAAHGLAAGADAGG
jgi:hypothetical protein